MDFFTELLESFSRKHNRKLRLLEAKNDPVDPSRVKSASEVLSNSGLGTQSNQIRVNGFVGGVQKPIEVKYNPTTGNLQVHNTYVSWNPTTKQIVSGDQKKLKKKKIRL